MTFRLFRGHEELGLEVGDLTAEPDLQRAGVEQADGADATLSGGERRPEGLDTDADGADDPDPGNDDVARALHMETLNDRSEP